MEGIDGKVAIVTGGSSGCGVGIARRFVRAGAKVVLADILDEPGQALAADLGHACRYVHADLRSDSELQALVDFTVRTYGGIDFLINSACTYADRGEEATREEWLDAYNINVFGHVVLLQMSRPHLVKSANASVVNFTTEAAHAGLAGRWVYPSSKASIEQLTKSQALDLAPEGIRVNSVLPGWVRKPMHDTAPPEVQKAYANWGDRLHMLGRLGTLDEVADTVLFLCSSHATFTTGSCMYVDGGHSAMGPQGREKVLPTALRKAGGATSP
ncbi:SDR family oxidoreductase [Hydrogenophaga sp.]|jgi:NAD(P)-dependent dehydrogenase (short-subunit alcohol dehydrogenase family)|uniref:SDR family oxidoreductase n=1 Tax=Hydrogenophaga sp. TaxID=1904254 RepID=UPI003F6ED210